MPMPGVHKPLYPTAHAVSVCVQLVPRYFRTQTATTCTAGKRGVSSKAIFWSDLEAFFFYYTSDGDFFQLDDRSSINVILRCIIEK